MSGAYNDLDLSPKERGEEALPFDMEWFKRHDNY